MCRSPSSSERRCWASQAALELENLPDEPCADADDELGAYESVNRNKAVRRAERVGSSLVQERMGGGGGAPFLTFVFLVTPFSAPLPRFRPVSHTRAVCFTVFKDGFC